MALSDFRKRTEILAELIYYIFDSFLIPLIQTNFYVTESSSHRNRLFFFRHDVWRALTEPAFSRMKSSMLEELEPKQACKLLDSKCLGFSQLRLLPKAKGMRSITNLRRRAQIIKNKQVILNKSINSMIAPVFSVLKYEKVSLCSQRLEVGVELKPLRMNNPSCLDLRSFRLEGSTRESTPSRTAYAGPAVICQSYISPKSM